MATKCTICGKGSITVGQRSRLRAGKYNPTTKRRQYPNIQWVKIPADVKRKNYKEFAGKRIKACTKCIKTLNKKK